MPVQFEGGPAGTPTVDGDKVYTLSHEGDLILPCRDQRQGALEQKPAERFWRHPPEMGIRWLAAGRWQSGHSSIRAGVGASTVALDKTTGAMKWKAGNDERRLFQSGRVRFGRGPLHRCFQSGRAGRPERRQRTGALALSVEDQLSTSTRQRQSFSATRFSSPPAMALAALCCRCALGKVTEIWRNKNMRSQLGSPVLVRGYIYGIDGNRRRRRVALSRLSPTERSSGRQNIGGGALIAAGGYLLVLNERGELIVAEASPTNYREVARAQVLGGHCWVAPAVADGKIYCKNNQGSLVCLDGH